MKRHLGLLWVALTLSLSVPGDGAFAAWIPNGTGVCVAVKDQRYVGVVGDGNGGTFIGWQDGRADSTCQPEVPHTYCSYDIYTQHLTPDGDVAPGWPENGLAVCTASENQFQLKLLSDGAGGVFLIWIDWRPGSAACDIYAQRITASGTLALGWLPDGLPVCTADGCQIGIRCTEDGTGGFYVAWIDDRVTGVTGDVFAQHVTSDGAIAPGWPADGLPVGVAPGAVDAPVVASDGGGGVLVAWPDERDWPSGRHIFAQHLTATGSIVSGWVENGIPIAKGYAAQFPTMVPDGTRGALVAWVDYSTASGDFIIVAQRVTAGGSVAQGWPANGVTLAHSVTNGIFPRIATDGREGGLVGWTSWESQSERHVMALRILGDGSIDPEWPQNGLAVCSAVGSRGLTSIIPDGFGGALATWGDGRSGLNSDVYVQRIAADGRTAPGWPADGLAVCTEPNDQSPGGIALDAVGGAVVAWHDGRNGTDADIFAQRVGLGGGVPTETGRLAATEGRLSGGSPNPFVDATHFALTVAAGAVVTLDVFDVWGRLVRNLARERFEAGTHWLRWDGRGDANVPLPVGVYVVRAQAHGLDASHKIVLAR